MDRVTKSFITDFSKSFGFEAISEDSELFEHFVNYTIMEPKTEYRFDIERINIGYDGTIGIDGFALLINNQLIDTIEELEDFLEEHKKCTAEIIFIQSKLSPKFNSKEIGGFGFAVNDFIAEEQKLRWSSIALEKIYLFNSLLDKISELKENPICSLYYVTLGMDEKDTNVYASIDAIRRNIQTENIFCDIKIELIGAHDLQKKYKKIGQAVEKSFEFSNRVPLPVINNVEEAYIGVVNASSIIDLMTNDEGSLLPNVFYDNVRDFQGSNKVNNEIAKTVQSPQKDSFAILNNGITIVAEELVTSRNIFTISNYQIINGCQTSHVLFENKNLIDDSVKVPIKLVISESENLTSMVIRSTNRQTEVKEQDLIAFSNFQKRLEDYYSTFKGNERLFYERRSKQYNHKSVERKKIIDKTTQIKAIASFYYDKPDMATRFFGTLFSEFGDKLFKDSHEMFPYYVASYAIYNIELNFRLKKIDKKYKKIKYHILMMFRHEIQNIKCPSFESKKSVKYCENIFEILKDEMKTIDVLNTVINKIDTLDFDPNDNEISKSKEFVKNIVKLYNH